MMNDLPGGMDTPRRSVQIPLFDRTLTTEVVGDYTLPDYQPEIKRLLRIGVNVLPPNRFAGSGASELNGTLDYYVLYMGHDNALYCAPLSAEYRLTADTKSEESGTPGRDPGRLYEAGEPIVCACDTVTDTPVGRVIAPRRLNIRCRVKSNVKLYGECPLSDGGMSDGGTEGESTTEILRDEAEVGRLYWGLGDTLALQDDMILAPADSEWRVVCAEGQVMMTEATAAMGMVNCRGEVILKLTMCPADQPATYSSDITANHDGDAPSASNPPTCELTVMQRKIPFAHTVDIEGVTPACTATACGYCTEISVQMEEGHLHMDLGVVTEVRAQRNETVSYVKDLYSTHRTGSCRYTTYPTESAVRALNGNFTLSDSLPLTEVGMDPAARVVDVTAVAAPEALTADAGKGRCVLTGQCRCHLLLLRDGEYSAADMELPFRYEFDDSTLNTLSEQADANGADTRFDGSVTVVTCRARMDGERVGMDAELAVSLRTHRPSPLTALSEVSFGDSVTRRRGEYVICFPAPTDSLWSVAKRYHAPMAVLTAANNLSSAAPADAVESLEGVGYLIV